MDNHCLDPQARQKVAECLRALAHPIRLQIVLSLCRQECNVGKIWKQLGISQPLASQHLHRLRRAGLVITERRGQEICYRAADPKLLAWLKRWCTQISLQA